MSDKKDFNNIGDQIKEVVEDALSSMDFKKLNDTISSTVNGALDEVRKQFDHVSNATQNTAKDVIHKAKTSVEDATSQYTKPNKYKPNEMQKWDKKQTGLRVPKNPVGQISGILYTVFGGIGLGLTVVVATMGGLIIYADGTIAALPFGLVAGGFFLLFTGMINKGTYNLDRLKRFNRYLQICGNKTYCDIKTIADHTGKKPKKVLKDLKKMLLLNMLPQGHLDEKETCLMLDDKTYQEYLEAERRKKEQEEFDLNTLNREEQKKEVSQPKSEVEIMIEEGQEYIAKLKDFNEAIDGAVISEKLLHLERVLTAIFDMIKEHPKQLPQMRKFMDYYLPTTLKLVSAYADFNQVKIQGDNISSAKEEIEKTFDTINKAFEKLLDDLYQDAAFDATTDAQVLKTLLTQEGLAEDKAFTDSKEMK